MTSNDSTRYYFQYWATLSQVLSSSVALIVSKTSYCTPRISVDTKIAMRLRTPRAPHLMTKSTDAVNQSFVVVDVERGKVNRCGTH